MQILKPNITNIITAPCREFDENFEVLLDFYNEGDRSHDQISLPSAVYSNGLVTFSLLEVVTEANFYLLILSQGNKELCKIKCFCTAEENLQNYSITKGDFTTPTQDNNNFIVI